MIVLSPKIIRDIDKLLELEHATFQQAGDRLFEVFEPRDDRVSSQVRNLQQVTCAAVRLSQIENFIKNQAGRSQKVSKQWRQVGPLLLQQLEHLRRQAAAIAKANQLNEDEELAVRLRLARGWVSAVVAQYMYRFGLKQMRPSGAK